VEEQSIRELLTKCMKGYIPTAEEEKLLETWYDAFPEHKDLTFASVTEQSRVKSEIKIGIFKGINQTISEPETMPAKRWFIFPELVMRVAAAILVLISLGGVWFYFSNDKPDPAQYISITAPSGNGNLLVYLPDSSTVWLHPGSTLKYPKQFAKSSREVELIDGIAFFDVKHNEHAAFIVHAPGGIHTKVLGTRFNIKDYKDLPDAEISLVTGSISIKDSAKQLALLKPNQQLQYIKATGNSLLLQVSLAKQLSWLEGQTTLQDATFEEVALTIKDVYNVPVLYNKQEMSALRFNIQFHNTLSLTQVLDLLRDISSIDYKLSGNELRIGKDNSTL
jgi:transmembrane sensor